VVQGRRRGVARWRPVRWAASSVGG
jgi:hypothetical protein